MISEGSFYYFGGIQKMATEELISADAKRARCDESLVARVKAKLTTDINSPATKIPYTHCLEYYTGSNKTLPEADFVALNKWLDGKGFLMTQ